jgi:hypothetical protein
MADPNMNWLDWKAWLYTACGLIGLVLTSIVVIPLFILDVVLGFITKGDK